MPDDVPQADNHGQPDHLSADVPQGDREWPVSQRLANDDLAPATQRNWGTRSLFALWMCDVHSLGGYTFAAGLFFLGLVGWQVFLALIIGITLVFIFMNLTGFAGQQTGVPYPVLARVSFGLFGANLPALIRAAVAIAWYGIQTWLASVAVVVLAIDVWPSLGRYTNSNFLGLSPLGWVCFLVLWCLQLVVIRRGMETVRKFQDWAGPAIWVVMLVLAIWMLITAGGDFSLNVSSHRVHGGLAVNAFFVAIALTVAYFSTLMLNFCDFSRFAPDRRTVVRGNFWGLPINFLAFTIVVVIVTAGSVPVFGETITDPVEVVRRIDNVWVTGLGAFTFAVATIGINVVANFVSASYDLANLAPRWIDFRRGGLISAVLAVVILPWHLYSSPVAINYFLSGLGALLGPLFGIIFADYYLLRRQRVNVADLYHEDPQGPYFYRKGWNPRALAAFAPSAAVALAVAVVPAVARLVPGEGEIAPYSWFVGAGLGAGLYLRLTWSDRSRLWVGDRATR